MRISGYVGLSLRVALFIGVFAFRGVAADGLKPGDFASAETCKPCHETIYKQWSTSYHSKAATDPVFWKIFEAAVREGDEGVSAYCLTCHIPVATVTKEVRAFGDLAEIPEFSKVAKEGVTCDFCHTISGDEDLAAKSSAGVFRMPHEVNTETKYGTHADAQTPHHPTKPSAFLQDPKFCGMCHRFAHPVAGTMLQNTFQEWQRGPYSKEGRRCQDCHMPNFAGRSATDGPERSDLNAHVFIGGHSEMLQKAATISLRAKSGKGKLKVTTSVTNVGSGHMMPTGIPGIRELWLEVKVNAASGAELASERVEFGATLLDRDGKQAMPWNAVKVGRDSRLPPRKTRKTTIEFPVSGGGEVRISGTLYYRTISEAAAKVAGLDVPAPISVATDELTIRVGGSN